MKILTIADCNDKLTYENLKEYTGLVDKSADNCFNIAVFLGNNSENDVQTVIRWIKERAKNAVVPCVGVLGNRDTPNVLLRENIKNLHLKSDFISGFVFLGFSGAVKCSDEDSGITFTQEESLGLLDEVKKCDVFITHSNPQFFEYTREFEPESTLDKVYRVLRGWKRKKMVVQQPLKNDADSGLVGIGNYIDSCEPSFVLCGHLHERKIEKRKNTVIFNCYGVQVINIEWNKKYEEGEL